MTDTASASRRARTKVLVVDDQLAMAEMVADDLGERGYDAKALDSSREAARLLENDDVDALVTDLRMADPDGIALLELSKRIVPGRPVIIMTAYGAVDSAIESIRRGAYHYLTKPFKMDELALFLQRGLEEAALRREAVSLRKALKERAAPRGFIAESESMREAMDVVERVADTTVPVLIVGETGTGKGLVARFLHSKGSRTSAPFVTVNCTALPEALLESELFGHVKGAFTGATAHRVGLFEEANGGTLFLDEIGDLSPSLQAKLLDVLERGVIRAVGADKERAVNVRVIAATHRDLRERVASGQFREDLLYRLDVVTVHLPALRQRRDDIPLLIEHFLAEAKKRHPSSAVERFTRESVTRLCDYGWPGNVRELEHLVERTVLLGRSPEVLPSELPSSITERRAGAVDFGPDVLPLREMQRRYVAWAYDRLGSRKLVTAEKLGIDDKTLARWLSREPDGTG